MLIRGNSGVAHRIKHTFFYNVDDEMKLKNGLLLIRMLDEKGVPKAHASVLIIALLIHACFCNMQGYPLKGRLRPFS